MGSLTAIEMFEMGMITAEAYETVLRNNEQEQRSYNDVRNDLVVGVRALRDKK